MMKAGDTRMRLLAERLYLAHHLPLPTMVPLFEDLSDEEQARWMSVAVEAASLLEVRTDAREEET